MSDKIPHKQQVGVTPHLRPETLCPGFSRSYRAPIISKVTRERRGALQMPREFQFRCARTQPVAYRSGSGTLDNTGLHQLYLKTTDLEYKAAVCAVKGEAVSVWRIGERRRALYLRTRVSTLFSVAANRIRGNLGAALRVWTSEL